MLNKLNPPTLDETPKKSRFNERQLNILWLNSFGNLAIVVCKESQIMDREILQFKLHNVGGNLMPSLSPWECQWGIK